MKNKIESHYIHSINKVVDENVKEILLKFIDSIDIEFLLSSNTFSASFKHLVNEIKREEPFKFDWNSFMKHINCSKLNNHFVTALYKYIYCNGYADCQFKEYILNNLWVLETRQSSIVSNYYYKGILPIFLHELNDESGKFLTRFIVKSENKFIHEILDDYLNTLSEKQVKFTRVREFVESFHESFKSCELSKVEDFNLSVFENQLNYYSRKDKRDEHRPTSQLIQFYIFLMKKVKLENKDIKFFSEKDGINQIFLSRQKFVPEYQSGFRVVQYNSSGIVPTEDKWIITREVDKGFTLSISETKSQSMDFTVINDIKLRYYLKKYFISKNISLFSKIKMIYILLQFFRYYEQTDNENLFNNVFNRKNREYDFETTDVLAYINHSKEINQVVLNKLFGALRDFLRFVIDEKAFSVDPYIFTFLKGKKIKGVPNPLNDDIMSNILLQYRLNAESGNITDKLHRICLTLILTTNLRAYEIMTLKRDCIKYGNKSNKSIVEIKTYKKDRGTKILEFAISEQTMLLIEEAIRITSNLQIENIESEVANYIFIHKSYYNELKRFNSELIHERFKKVTEDLGISEPITLGRIRDTYMSNLINYGDSYGLSLTDIHVETGHKSLKTTYNHYFKRDKKKYLELFYGVVISDIDIKGNIIIKHEEFDEKANENMTLGACLSSNSKCVPDYCCLKCDDFRTTSERIDVFKEHIELVEEELLKATLPDDIEYFREIKAILVAYITKIYELIEEA